MKIIGGSLNKALIIKLQAYFCGYGRLGGGWVDWPQSFKRNLLYRIIELASCLVTYFAVRSPTAGRNKEVRWLHEFSVHPHLNRISWGCQSVHFSIFQPRQPTWKLEINQLKRNISKLPLLGAIFVLRDVVGTSFQDVSTLCQNLSSLSEAVGAEKVFRPSVPRQHSWNASVGQMPEKSARNDGN